MASPEPHDTNVKKCSFIVWNDPKRQMLYVALEKLCQFWQNNINIQTYIQLFWQPKEYSTLLVDWSQCVQICGLQYALSKPKDILSSVCSLLNIRVIIWYSLCRREAPVCYSITINNYYWCIKCKDIIVTCWYIWNITCFQYSYNSIQLISSKVTTGSD